MSKLLVRSIKTNQEQELSQKDLDTLDPNKTKFVVLKKSTTPPEAVEAKAKQVSKPAEEAK